MGRDQRPERQRVVLDELDDLPVGIRAGVQGQVDACDRCLDAQVVGPWGKTCMIEDDPVVTPMKYIVGMRAG